MLTLPSTHVHRFWNWCQYMSFKNENWLLKDSDNRVPRMCSSPYERWKHEKCFACGRRLTKADTVVNIWLGAMGNCMGNQALSSVSDWLPLCIIKDHKPLLSLRKIPLYCDPTRCLARWALEIDTDDWTIYYRQGTKHANADPSHGGAWRRHQGWGVTNQVGNVTHADSDTQTDHLTSLSGMAMRIDPMFAPSLPVAMTVTSPWLSSTENITAVTMNIASEHW